MMTQQQNEVSAAATVEASLPLSWNSGAGFLYWYRVEGECEQPKCETMGLEYPCPKMTVITTVAAPSIPELCEILANPVSNAPFTAKIVSLRRYTRPVLKVVPPSDECNILEEVEFCQIPECETFCYPIPNPNLSSLVDTTPRLSLAGSLSGLADYDFGTEINFDLILSEDGTPILSEAGDEILASSVVPTPLTEWIELTGSADVHCTFFAHDSYGSLELLGSSYFISPSGQFESSGSVVFSGSFPLVSIASPSGGVLVSGAAHCYPRISFAASGSMSVGGVCEVESPSYFVSPSGSVFIDGFAIVPMRDLGSLGSSADLSSSAIGLGIEQSEQPVGVPLSISDFTVSACGCPSIGPALEIRHNLNASDRLSRFLSSEGLSYPSTITMRHRSSDSSWTSSEFLGGSKESWTLSFLFACMDDFWRLSLSASNASRRTKFVLDIPSDMVCERGFGSISVVSYLKSYSFAGSGVSIPAVTPSRNPSRSVSGPIESLVDGIFVPHTVYYDEMELFADSFWNTSPFELEVNPLVRNKTTFQDLSWV